MTMKKMPPIGLGTWNLRGDECTKTIQIALDLGYRHIDTAFNYDNQVYVGKAVQGFDREKLFITSKVMLDQGDVEEICGTCLKELKLDFLDLYLIHWPDRSKPLDVVLEKMEKLKKQGKIKAYGVSNFTIAHLQDCLDLKAHIFCNQVEFHPYLYQKELLDFCKKHSIELVAYRPLGKGALLNDPIVCQIAKDKERTASQILLRFLFQKQIPFVVKASSENHLKDNLSLDDFSLTKEEIIALESLNKNKRFCSQSWSDFDYRGL